MLNLLMSFLLLQLPAFSSEKVIIAVLSTFEKPEKLGENFRNSDSEGWDDIEANLRNGAHLFKAQHCTDEVELKDYDTKGTIEGTLKAIKSAEADGAKLLIGFINSSTILTINKLYPDRKIPAITTTATNDEVPSINPPTLQMAFNNTVESKALAKVLGRIPKRSKERMFLLTDVTNPFSVELSQKLKKFTSAKFKELEYSTPLKWAPRNWPIEELKKATALIMTGEGAEVLEVVSNLSKFNRNYVLIGGDAWYRGNITGYLPAKGVYIPDTIAMGHWSIRFQDRKSVEFTTEYRKRFNPGPGGAATLANDAVMVACEIWKKKRSLRFEDFIGPSFHGVTGITHFTPNGAQDKRRPALYWFRDGEYHDEWL